MKNNFRKTSARKKMVLDTIAVFFIAITPFLYKLHDFLPVNDPDAVISFLGITIGSNGFADVSTYVWFLTVKLVPLFLLLIWFFTSRVWWYHILLIPIAMYAFQIFEAVFSEDRYVDTENLFWVLPVCMVVIPFVYLIRLKLYDKYVHGIDLEAMQKEINVLETKQLSKKEIKNITAEIPKIEYRTLSEWLNQEFSTANLQRILNQFQSNVKTIWSYIF